MQIGETVLYTPFYTLPHQLEVCYIDYDELMDKYNQEI